VVEFYRCPNCNAATGQQRPGGCTWCKPEAITSNEQVLLKALKYLARHYVGQLENARDRIVSLGGQCDPVDVMERGDPHLKQVREVIASVEATSAETPDVAGLAARIARGVFAIGDMPGDATQRIAFKGGTYPGKETDLGGLCESALADVLQRLLTVVPTPKTTTAQGDES
jgi:hypothetical protein